MNFCWKKDHVMMSVKYLSGTHILTIAELRDKHAWIIAKDFNLF